MHKEVYGTLPRDIILNIILSEPKCANALMRTCRKIHFDIKENKKIMACVANHYFPKLEAEILYQIKRSLALPSTMVIENISLRENFIYINSPHSIWNYVTMTMNECETLIKNPTGKDATHKLSDLQNKLEILLEYIKNNLTDKHNVIMDLIINYWYCIDESKNVSIWTKYKNGAYGSLIHDAVFICTTIVVIAAVPGLLFQSIYWYKKMNE